MTNHLLETVKKLTQPQTAKIPRLSCETPSPAVSESMPDPPPPESGCQSHTSRAPAIAADQGEGLQLIDSSKTPKGRPNFRVAAVSTDMLTERRAAQLIEMVEEGDDTTRHAAASDMLAEGVDLATVADTMRHASPAFTLSTYVHAIDERLTANADRLDARRQITHPTDTVQDKVQTGSAGSD